MPGPRRSQDAIFLDGLVYYATSGPHLVARWEADKLGDTLEGVSVDACIKACEDQAEKCTQFRCGESSGL